MRDRGGGAVGCGTVQVWAVLRVSRPRSGWDSEVGSGGRALAMACARGNRVLATTSLWEKSNKVNSAGSVKVGVILPTVVEHDV